MPKLSPTERDKAWDLCAKRDGKKCRRCRKPRTKDNSVVDHIDNNPINNPANGSNWQILCDACNTKKNPRGPGRRGIDVRHKMRSLERERERGRDNALTNVTPSEPEDSKTRADSESMRRNIERKPKFLDWLKDMILDMQTIAVEDVVNGGAKHSGLSQQTIRRYLDQECSIVGAYEYYNIESGTRHIRFRPETENGKLSLAVQNWKRE